MLHHTSSENVRPKVAMIVIGDEILSGKTRDLNAYWLSQFLFRHGIELTFVTFILDQSEQIKFAVKNAQILCDIIITSGGIGPTIDDRTKNTLAQHFNKTCNHRKDVEKIVIDNYHRFGRKWTPSTNEYHYFPEDFLPLKNPLGLAPGLFYQCDLTHKYIFSAPGVPREFQAMMESEILPIIQNKFVSTIGNFHQMTIRTFDVPEEKIFNELVPTLWTDLEKFGKVSSLPNTLGIDIVITSQKSESEFINDQLSIKNIIERSQLSSNVWRWNAKSIAESVLEKALEKKITFAFAESCTGGLLSSKITDLSGASHAYFGSVNAYDNSLKKNILKVQNETLQKYGAVSIETAKEMAIGARELCQTDFAISTTGIAGPNGATAEKPVGTIAIGISSKDKTDAFLFHYPGDRLRLKERFAERALLLLYQHLCK